MQVRSSRLDPFKQGFTKMIPLTVVFMQSFAAAVLGSLARAGGIRVVKLIILMRKVGVKSMAADALEHLSASWW